jgi:hypothetical protein
MTFVEGLAVPTAATLAVLAEGPDALPLDLLTFPDDSPRERSWSKKELDGIITPSSSESRAV